MFAVTGAVDRLNCLSTICCDLGFAEIARRGRNQDPGLRSPYYFLAVTLDDLAKGLKAACRIYQDDLNATDDAAMRPPKKEAGSEEVICLICLTSPA
jgi:hypothetical protein